MVGWQLLLLEPIPEGQARPVRSVAVDVAVAVHSMPPLVAAAVRARVMQAAILRA